MLGKTVADLVKLKEARESRLRDEYLYVEKFLALELAFSAFFPPFFAFGWYFQKSPILERTFLIAYYRPRINSPDDIVLIGSKRFENSSPSQ